jgi:hypothetical protein
MWVVDHYRYKAYAETLADARELRKNNRELKHARIKSIIQMQPSKVEYGKVYDTYKGA